MQMKAFYKVKTDRYFFNRTDGPEECVRQWVIAELLSTYGININEIEIEVPVKIGTRIHYADIVIYKEQVPYIVIECKRQEIQNLETALEQSISYANSNKLKASFAVCTNGNEWLVRRKIGQTWEIVPEMEVRNITNPTMQLSSFLFLVEALHPVFFWLHRSIPAERAMEFFSKVHELLYKAAFRRVGKGLHTGFDHLIRVLSNDPTLSKKYGMDKMSIAFEAFMDYLTAVGIREYRVGPEGYHNYELVNILLGSFEELTISSIGVNNEESKWLRLVTVHLQYLMEILRAGQLLDVPETVMKEYHAFLKPFCENQLGVKLPDSVEQEEIRFVRAICEYLD